MHDHMHDHMQDLMQHAHAACTCSTCKIPLQHLDDKRVQEVHPLWWRGGIVQPRVALRDHLHLYVVEVTVAWRVGLKVALGDVVVAILPIHRVEEMGVDLDGGWEGGVGIHGEVGAVGWRAKTGWMG